MKMFLNKLILKIKKPTVVGIGGKNPACLGMVEEVLRDKLGQTIKVGLGGPFDLLKTDVLILKVEEGDDFTFADSERSILIGTAVGNIPPRSEVFSARAEQVKPILKSAKKLKPGSLLMVNYDDEAVREIIDDEEVKCDCLEYGLGRGAEVRASDIKISEKGTSFKLNYEGNTVPVWLKNLVGKRQIYSALVTCGLGVELGLNLVDVTQSLRNYRGAEGEGQLKVGIKKTKILDDSANADPFSMTEALFILSDIKNKMEEHGSTKIRKIAVLGDILKVGKYAVEAHQTLGERAAENVDVLFTVGPRAKFIGNEANIQGLKEENIHHFNEVGEAALALQEEMKPSDLVLVDGAAEMEMEKVVEEIEKK